MLNGIFLYCTFVYLQASSARLVGYGNDSYDIITVLYEFVQRSNCEFRSTHIYNTCLLEHSYYLAFDFIESALYAVCAEDGCVIDCFP